MDKRKSIQVDKDTWRLARQYALDAGMTVRWVVTLAVSTLVAETARSEIESAAATRKKATSAAVRPVAATDVGSEVGPEEYLPPKLRAAYEEMLQPDPELRCACGQRLKDHQGGASKQLAVVTNCRNFRVTE